MKVTLIPGDGIGPEVTNAAREVVAAAGAEVEWEVVEAGAAVAERTGTPLPETVLDSIRKNRVALKGPVGTPIGKGFRSVNVALRQTLDLFACLRPVKRLPGVVTPFPDVDLVIVRENTEGMYSGIEHMVVPGVAESLKVITAKASMRIVDYAFRLARHESRKSVVAVHKANIMKVSDGLFLECARTVAARYSEIEYRELIVDNCAMQLVKNPKQFDVLVMGNLYGDVMSDLAAGLVGGLGVVPGANIGDGHAVFEAVHGSAPDIAGKGLANPTAVVLSSALMLRHTGHPEVAAKIEGAVHRVYEAGRIRTGDLGGSASTRQMTDAILAAL